MTKRNVKGRPPMYCSPDCRGEAHKRRAERYRRELGATPQGRLLAEPAARRCVRCAAEFLHRSSSALYCSKECRYAVYRERHRTGKIDSRRADSDVLTCKGCGTSFQHKRRGGSIPDYCNPRCRPSQMRLQRAAEIHCVVCGVKCSNSTSGRQRIYCSPECRSRGLHRPSRYRAAETIACKHCGAEVVRTYGKVLFCTDKCKTDHGNQKAKAARRRARAQSRIESAARGTRGTLPWVTGQCERCGDWYVGRDTFYGRRFCTYRCGVGAAYLRRVSVDRSHRLSRAARLALFDRDDWTCRICGDGIDPDLRWPDPGSATIDHIVPVSHLIASGVNDDESNWQTAHAYCNVTKSNRVGFEFATAAS